MFRTCTRAFTGLSLKCFQTVQEQLSNISFFFLNTLRTVNERLGMCLTTVGLIKSGEENIYAKLVNKICLKKHVSY